MPFEIGEILCFKTTGEVCVVLSSPEEDEDDIYRVRRPVMKGEAGIAHEITAVGGFELETEEQHLRREGQSMLLKYRIQSEIQDTIEDQKKKAGSDRLVN